MTGSAGPQFHASPINMNSPGSLLHWSIFQVTVANLVLIAVMVVIFGAALLLPFPLGRRDARAPATGTASDDDAPGPAAETSDLADDGAAGMWWSRPSRRESAAENVPAPQRHPVRGLFSALIFGLGLVLLLLSLLGLGARRRTGVAQPAPDVDDSQVVSVGASA